jgi:hypothetical protein
MSIWGANGQAAPRSARERRSAERTVKSLRGAHSNVARRSARKSRSAEPTGAPLCGAHGNVARRRARDSCYVNSTGKSLCGTHGKATRWSTPDSRSAERKCTALASKYANVNHHGFGTSRDGIEGHGLGGVVEANSGPQGLCVAERGSVTLSLTFVGRQGWLWRIVQVVEGLRSQEDVRHKFFITLGNKLRIRHSRPAWRSAGMKCWC